jgi:uncharacterized protein
MLGTMLREMFGVAKPAIAMVQLRPLPGSYRYEGEPLKSIIASALSDADVLAQAGFHGFQLQNMGDNPSSRHVGPETVAYMTSAALALRQAFPEISLSILVNWDAEASIAVADATGADFIRIEHTYTGVSVTSWGLSEACCYEATRFHSRIGARARIFADVFEPHATPLVHRPVEQAAKATVYEGGADGIFITGTDFSQSMEWLKSVRRVVPDVPIFLGGGATPGNVGEALAVADGVSVATWIKGGDMRNSVDPLLARTFMEAVREAANE